MELQSLKSLAGGWPVSGKRCDYCKTMAASVFCRADSAFLCANCDNRVHCLVKHGRVMMCEVCEQAPAAVTCKADAAALCISCDSDIHSANPLARRHDRVPVEPFFDSSDSVVKYSSAFSFLVPNEEEEDSTVSWLLQTNTSSNIINAKSEHDGDLLFAEIDPFLDVGIHQNSNTDHDHHRSSVANDSVVPVQIPIMANDPCYDTDFCRSKLSSFNYSTQCLSQSVSSSSLDVGVVPDGNFISDASHFGRNLSSDTDRSGPISGNNTNNQAAPTCALDREARVLRYREKRKNRKFEKTIRYASRKAYAEARPRIKGRFAKRTEIDSDLLFNSASSIAYRSDTQYSVVPTF